MSAAQAAVQCPYCGGEQSLDVLEIWQGGEFMLDACCEAMQSVACEILADDPKQGAQWLCELPSADVLCAIAGVRRGARTRAVRRVLDVGGQLLLDFAMTIRSITLSQAKTFVARHHRHCRPPRGWRFGASVWNGHNMVGVATVGRPVARAFDHHKIVEVNRVCVREDLTDGLAWNACSQLYGWAAREAQRRGFEKVITYTLASESGASLRAAGYEPEAMVRGRSWDQGGRPRPGSMPPVDKIRWAKALKRSTRRGAQDRSRAAPGEAVPRARSSFNSRAQRPQPACAAK